MEGGCADISSVSQTMDIVSTNKGQKNYFSSDDSEDEPARKRKKQCKATEKKSRQQFPGRCLLESQFAHEADAPSTSTKSTGVKKGEHES